MKNILITGAASGLGRELCLQLSGPQTTIFAFDKNDQGLKQLKRQLNATDDQFKAFNIDLSDLDGLQNLLEAFKTPIDFLINNAGVIPGGYFQNVNMAAHVDCHHVNYLSPMLLTHHFLNQSISTQRPLHILQIASASALIGFPQASSYAASKWALLGLSESIYRELSDQNIDWIHLTVACPSYINTDLFAGAKPPLFQKALNPTKLAATILEAVERKQFIVKAPAMINLIPLLKALLPFRIWNLFLKKMGVDKGMKTWKQHQKS